jgi:hypothetical protein
VRRLLSIALLLTITVPLRADDALYLLADNWMTKLEDTFGAPQTPHPSVVRVTVPEGDATAYGSGTLVDANDTYGLIITNWHVVRDAKGEITVAFPDGFQSPAQVLKMDRDWDLAALLIRKPNVKPVPLAKQPPKPGDMLTIAGYGRGKYRSASGACTQYVAPSLNHPYEMVELAASARQGDSGGPIFNQRGELSGVLFGEGFGRTSGSYCGRVHWFLSSLTPTTPTGIAPALRPRQPIDTNLARAQVQTSTAPPVTPPPSAPAPDAAPSGITPIDLEDPGAAARDRATPWRAASDAQENPPANEVAASSAELPLWQQLAGSTRLEQIKTSLAMVGALALILHSLHWIKTA